LGSKDVGVDPGAASARTIVTGVLAPEMVAELSSVLVMTSAGDGDVLLVALQPGLTKIRINAKTWMPTTTPKILSIFMEQVLGG